MPLSFSKEKGLKTLMLIHVPLMHCIDDLSVFLECIKKTSKLQFTLEIRSCVYLAANQAINLTGVQSLMCV